MLGRERCLNRSSRSMYHNVASSLQQRSSDASSTPLSLADHTMGTLTFLRTVLGIPKPKVPGVTPDPPNSLPPRVEIFGPRGIRRMLRMLWHMTHTHSEHPYVVHELLFPGEQPSVAADGRPGGYDQETVVDEMDVRRESECAGRLGSYEWGHSSFNLPRDDLLACFGALSGSQSSSTVVDR